MIELICLGLASVVVMVVGVLLVVVGIFRWLFRGHKTPR